MVYLSHICLLRMMSCYVAYLAATLVVIHGEDTSPEYSRTTSPIGGTGVVFRGGRALLLPKYFFLGTPYYCSLATIVIDAVTE